VIVVSAFLVIPIILFFVAKYYFSLMEKLHSKGAASSKPLMFFSWLAVSFIVFLSAYIPISILKKEAPNSDIKWGILPLLVSMVLIFLFQRNEIKRIGTLLNVRK